MSWQATNPVQWAHSIIILKAGFVQTSESEAQSSLLCAAAQPVLSDLRRSKVNIVSRYKKGRVNCFPT